MLGVEQVGQQGQQPGSVSQAVAGVADELDGLGHRVLQLSVLLTAGQGLQRGQGLQGEPGAEGTETL